MESSVGQSSRTYYYNRSRDCGGVPFRWEMQPGTPLNPQLDHDMPPLSPPPSIQGLGLPLPNVSHEVNVRASHSSKYKIKGLKKKMVKTITKEAENLSKRMETLVKRRSKETVVRSKVGENIVNLEIAGSVQGSSFSSYSSSSHCIIQSSALPRPQVRYIHDDAKESKWAMTRTLFGKKQDIKTIEKEHHEVSFRYDDGGSLRGSTSVSSLSSKAMLKMKRCPKGGGGGGDVSCGGANWSKTKILDLARKKLKFLST